MAENDTDLDIEDILERHNSTNLKKMLPAILFLMLIMIISFVGNLLVLYVYLVRFKPNTLRCFIIALAALDLGTCVLDIPLEIVDIGHKYTFGRLRILCKVFHLFHDFFSIASMYILLAVAVERYKKVCQPFQNQMTISSARMISIMCCLVALIFAIPAWFKYGTKVIPTDTEYVNGTQCYTADDHNKILLLVNYGFWILQDFLVFSVLVLLYFLILAKVYSQGQYRKKVLSFESRPATNKCSQVSFESCPQSEKSCEEAEIQRPEINRVYTFNTELNTGDQLATNEEFNSEEQASEDQPVESQDNFLTSVADTSLNNYDARISHISTVTSATRSRDLRLKRMTRVMFLVSLVCILAYFPIICKMIIRLASRDALKRFKDGASWFYEIFARTYYIPCAANPLIYSFCNTHFRGELKHIVVTIKRKGKCNT